MRKNKFFSYKLPIHVLFVIYSALCIIPFLLIVSISFSFETDILENGFKFIPEHFVTDAYNQVFQRPDTLFSAYLVTIFFAVVATVVSIVTQAMMGYTLSRDVCAFRKPVTIMLLITMFFSGGLIPTYIITTQIFHMGNTIWVYVFHATVVPSTVFVFRTFFSGIPTSLIESAQLDGATEMNILWKIVVPLSKPVIATMGFNGLLSRWNNYDVSMYYINEERLYTLQYMLQQILNEAAYLKALKDSMPHLDDVVIPSETLKFALCVLASAPMLCVFPFFQKYFTKGMVVGAVKG